MSNLLEILTIHTNVCGQSASVMAMVIAAVLGYLFGSIPTAVLLGRRLGFDPRELGDGNPGWWNMRTQIGDRKAAFVFLLDIAKGVAPVAISLNLWGPWWWGYVAALFAVVGHSFPVFARFHGGRGVLTFMGAMAVLAPLAIAVTVIAGIVVTLACRKFAYGARVMVFGVPVVQAFMPPETHVLATGILMTFVGLRFLAAYMRDLSTSGRGYMSPA